jgi:molybdopterin-containing oxidoreductase family molybdopterin binding subunit
MMDKQNATGIPDDVWIPTACDMCYNVCSVRVHRVNGVAVKIEGVSEAPPNYGKVCAKGNAALMNLYNPHRITAPLLRTNTQKGIGVDPKWKRISWDEAMNLMVEKLRAARSKDPRALVAATFDRASYFMLRAFMAAYGSPNATNTSAGFFCGNGVHPVAFTLTGSNDVHPDLKYCNYLLLFGSSHGFVAQQNAMGLAREMAEARMRGMKLVVVDPLCSYAASKADEWIPIRPGTDTAFALSMMNVLLNELNLYDEAYLKKYTNSTYLVRPDGHYLRDPKDGSPLVWNAREGRAGTLDAIEPMDATLEGNFPFEGVEARPAFQLFKEHLRSYAPESVSEITTIPVSTIRRVATELVQAARLGSTIRIDEQDFPFRPAAACWYRGISAHKHGMLNGMSVAQINLLLGAVDVPGGLINATAAGPNWQPQEGPDGLIAPGNPYTNTHTPPMPPRRVKQPETLELVELFPVSVYARTMLWLGVLHGEKFGLDYRPEVFIHCRTNMMAASGDPQVMAEAIKQVPFMISFATQHDETTEFADLLLPDTHALERLVPVVFNPYIHYNNAPLPGDEWCFNFQQPVVQPMGEARYWMEVLLEVAGKLDILSDLYRSFNVAGHLEEPHRLDPSQKYSWEEICDRWLKSYCGEEHGLSYFIQHGHCKLGKRTAAQTYPRLLHKGRIPLYLEHFIGAGKEVKKFTDEHNIPWDTSDYIPLTEWRPCPAHTESPAEYDLFVINQKVPFLTLTFTSENPWLVKLAHHNAKVFPVGMHAATGRKKGIADGDEIEIETPGGTKVRGLVRLTEGVHPECLSIPAILGRWVTSNDRARGQGVHFNSLLEYTVDRLDTLSAALDACVKVRVKRVGVADQSAAGMAS